MSNDLEYWEQVNKIATAINVLKEKEAIIKDLSSKEINLIANITKLESDKKALETENLKIFKSTEALNNRDVSEIENKKAFYEAKEEELKTKEEELKTKEWEILEMINKGKILNQENLKLEAKNKQLSDEAESKVKEAAYLKSSREWELKAIEEAQTKLNIERKHLETLKNEIQKQSAENTEILKEVNRSKADIQNQFDELHKFKQDNEILRNNAQRDINSSDYLLWVLRNMVMVFRQELTRFIQINGSQVRIAELTNEHRQIIIDDLKKQIAENSETVIEVKAEEPIEVKEDYSLLTKAQIISKLTEFGIEFNPNSLKSDLIALLPE
jgi:hypothetical protein